MYKHVISLGIIAVLMVGTLPLIAEAAEEVPWAHILDHEFEADGKPDKPGKPPKDDPVTEEPPSGPTQTIPWGVDRIDADLVSLTGEGIKVAVLDTGIDNDHPDLTVAGGVNFVPKGPNLDSTKWDDDNGHGTHVAGTIAALDNSVGVVGVAPGVSLYAVKVLDRRGSGSLTWIINGINWAIQNDMDIISMSLSTDYDHTDFRNSIQDAYDAGIVIVAAAGNDGSVVDYPAAYSTVVAVSATTSSDGIASFSNRGSQIEVAAPGVSIPSTWKDGGYSTISGTSMACPHVTGVAALVLGANGSLTVEQVRTSLKDAEDLGTSGWDTYFGHGLVDAVAATT